MDVDAGLSPLLQAELERIGSDIQVSWPSPTASWSRADCGEREVQVAMGAEQSSFSVSLWAEGIEHLVGWAGSLAEVAAAINAWLSDAQPGGEEMAARFPFLKLDRLARAYERGEAIEHVWRTLLRDGPWFEALHPLVEAASAEPRLRQLRPWTSVDRLAFSRWVGFPFSHDLPYAAPRNGHFRVYRPNDDGYLSEKDEFVIGEDDANGAVKLLVGALPKPLAIVYRRPSEGR